MKENEFGIYILTYPGDFHLSAALVESIRHFNPDIPITLIPGEGFDADNHPFDVPIMETPEGFWMQMGHIDRKFWAYQGPYKKFLYVDSDMICTRNISSLVNEICRMEGNFIFTQPIRDNNDWRKIIGDQKHPLYREYIAHFQYQIGKLPILEQFDTEYDPYQAYPVNAGYFASSRSTFSEDDFHNLHIKEVEFHQKILGREFTWRNSSIFFNDQGRLNYLIQKKITARVHFSAKDRYIWGGVRQHIDVNMTLNQGYNNSFIHWSGIPRPSPSIFCKQPFMPILVAAYGNLEQGYGNLPELVGYSLWEHFYKKSKLASQWDTFSFSKKDFMKILVIYWRRAIKFVFG